MIPTHILRRLFFILAIIAIPSFSIGLYYKADASDLWFATERAKSYASERYRQCESEERSDCSREDFYNSIETFQDAEKFSRTVAFWWFLAGWLSVAVMVGYLVINWIVTGRPFGAKRDQTTG